MKSFIFTFVCSIGLYASTNLSAQPLAVGSTVSDINLVDIKGNKISLYSYLDQGYTVLVDLSATWCGPCWDFEKTGVGQSLYEKYGPSGTLAPKKMVFLFIEGDPQTNADDLKGTGKKTQGDWITGKTHPIVDADDWNVARHFLSPAATTINFPTFLMICPDKKVIWNTEGFQAGNNESYFVTQMGACGGVTGIEDKNLLTSLSLYPNPVSDRLQLKIHMEKATDAVLKVNNLLGQTILQQQVKMHSGEQLLSLETQSLPKGLYILTVSNLEGQFIKQKFIKR